MHQLLYTLFIYATQNNEDFSTFVALKHIYYETLTHVKHLHSRVREPC